MNRAVKKDWRLEVPQSMIATAAFDQLKEIVRSKTLKAFVWPDEGEFKTVTGGGDDVSVWTFDNRHAGFEPLYVDPTTANLLVHVHDALTQDDLKEKFRSWVAENRGTFAALVEFCWSRAKAPDTHAGGSAS